MKLKKKLNNVPFFLQGLVHSIPQMNNFVIYKGFFDEVSNRSAPNSVGSETKVDARYLFNRFRFHIHFICWVYFHKSNFDELSRALTAVNPVVSTNAL